MITELALAGLYYLYLLVFAPAKAEKFKGKIKNRISQFSRFIRREKN